MASFKFGSLGLNVVPHGLVKDLPDFEEYGIRVASPGGETWLERRLRVPVEDRTARRAVELASNVLMELALIARNPDGWIRHEQMVGGAPPEAIREVLRFVNEIKEYLPEALNEANDRMDVLVEHREGTPGPLEIGRRR